MGLFRDPLRPPKAGSAGPSPVPTPTPTPDAGVRPSFFLCSCFPHKLDTRLGNNVASLII